MAVVSAGAAVADRPSAPRAAPRYPAQRVARRFRGSGTRPAPGPPAPHASEDCRPWPAIVTARCFVWGAGRSAPAAASDRGSEPEAAVVPEVGTSVPRRALSALPRTLAHLVALYALVGSGVDPLRSCKARHPVPPSSGRGAGRYTCTADAQYLADQSTFAARRQRTHMSVSGRPSNSCLEWQSGHTA